MNRFFGEPWGAPFIADAEQVAAPVGKPCLECGELVAEGDQGLLVPHARAGDDGRPLSTDAPVHRECLVLGVFGHVAGTCFCHQGLGTMRERGRATVAWLEVNRQ
ncbi:hypothetical protein [Actinophytocola sp.]|uniref:hypothetical protein n=1 Tax=Actinophytocola sp. TaxID=1872138 RepID=UPI002D7F0FF3|nr:hypothetical protein [Actinophytocola sp.]HET9144086.1 hypothetical protein [Actinophytocola sp.]